MLFLKGEFRSDFYVWEIARIYHLSAFVFLTLSRIAVCESFSLFSSRNSSSIHSPLQITLLTSTLTLSGVAHGQILRSLQEQSSGKSSLETTINSVNDGFLSKFGVYTGNDKTSIHTTEVVSCSSLKLDTQIVDTTQGSHSVGKRNAECTKKSGLATGTILNTMAQTSPSQLNSRIGQELLSSSHHSGAIETRVVLPYFRHSAGSSIESNMVSSKVARVTQTTDPARDFSLMPSYETFTGSVSNLHATNYLLSTYNLSPGEERSKSSFLSRYSTGIAAQVGGVSTSVVQLTDKVLSTFTTSTINQVSSTFIRSTTTRISPYFTASSTITRASTSLFTSSFAVESSVKSAWSTPHLHLTVATTASSFALITSVQPLLSSVVPTQGKVTLNCKVNNATCVCFNCEEARKKGKICCIDLIDIKNIQQGVKMNMINVTVDGFHRKVKAVSRVIAVVVRDSCRTNASLCVTGAKLSGAESERKKRSLQELVLKNKPSSDRIRIKREALRPDMNPSLTNISRVDVIIYSINSKAGHPPGVQTAFYVIVTSLNNGTNQTVVLDGKGLLQILRNKKRTLENRLNITIDSFTASHQSSELATTSLPQATLAVTNMSPGSNKTQTPLSTREAVPTTAVVGRLENGDSKGLPQDRLVLIIGAGVGGLILIIIVLAFICTRFYRQRKGEFVPDKTYQNSHNIQNGEASAEDVENIASFIDPSTQITDVPHKPRGHSSTGGAGGGGKKQRKPMGVKVTYKPPAWD